MSSTPHITLYTANLSPYAHRVRIALEETGVKYTAYPIDIMTPQRPQWYSQVSPFGKVPAVTFGGPEVPPDQPSPESAKLFESVALLEFLADLFPENPHLLPKDLVKRAHARAFISIYQNYVNDLFIAVFFSGLPQTDALLDALAKLQGALPPDEGAFAVGRVVDRGRGRRAVPRAHVALPRHRPRAVQRGGRGEDEGGVRGRAVRAPEQVCARLARAAELSGDVGRR